MSDVTVVVTEETTRVISTPEEVTRVVTVAEQGPPGPAGTTDHGALTGLGDDDHTQYLNNTRGDARYYTKTQLDSGQLDSRYYTETEVNTMLGSYQLTSEKGVAGGYASLDGGGKVPLSQLPSSLMIYKGVWNASTNTPTLSDGTGTSGWVYRVTVAGSQNLGSGSISFNVGDYVIHNGTSWEKSDTTDAVDSVNGLTGTVTLTTTNIAEGTNLYFTSSRFNTAFSAKSTTDLLEGSNLYFTNARARSAISASGVISYNSTTGAFTLPLTSAQIIVGNASNIAAAVSMSGDITITNAGVTAIGTNKVTNAMIRQSAARSVIGRATSSTGNVADISAVSGSSNVLAENGTGAIGWSLIKDSNIAASGTANIAVNKLAAQTANRAAQFGTGGFLEPSSVNTTELSFLSGATSNIQSQIDNVGGKDISYNRRMTNSTFQRLFSPLTTGGATTEIDATGDEIWYFPVTCPRSWSANKAWCEVVTTGMGEFIIGIYSDDDMKPRALIGNTATLSEAVAVFSDYISASGDAGTVWVALHMKSSGGTFRAKVAAEVVNIMGFSVDFGSDACPIGYRESYTWTGSLPGSANPTQYYTSRMPLLGFETG